jgi:hypothetical protein
MFKLKSLLIIAVDKTCPVSTNAIAIGQFFLLRPNSHIIYMFTGFLNICKLQHQQTQQIPFPPNHWQGLLFPH